MAKKVKRAKKAKARKAKARKAKAAAPKVTAAIKGVVKETPAKKPGINEGRKFSIMGIICAVVSLIILPIVFGPLAIIFGIIGIKKGDKNWGMAAIILGVLFLIIILILALYLVSVSPSLIAQP